MAAMRDSSVYCWNKSNRISGGVPPEGQKMRDTSPPADKVDKAKHKIIGTDAWRTRQLKDGVLIDALDAQGVSNELIEVWTMQEAKALAPVLAAGLIHEDTPAAPALPQHVRVAALTYMSCNAQRLGLQQTSWVEAATLLDMFHLKMMDSSSSAALIESLPATCAALVSILKKFDCQIALVEPADVVPIACRFAEYMKGCGFSTVNVEVSAKAIETQERHLLNVLCWRIKVPTIESWATTLVARCNIITRDLLAPKLHWVWQQCLFYARLIIMQQQLRAEQPPKVLAVGLLGMGLLAASLLPLKVLQPPQMTTEEWGDLYAFIHPQSPHPQCEVPEKHVLNMLEVLTVTVGADIEVIQECCRVASLAMQNAMRDAPRSPVARDTMAPPGM